MDVYCTFLFLYLYLYGLAFSNIQIKKKRKRKAPSRSRHLTPSLFSECSRLCQRCPNAGFTLQNVSVLLYSHSWNGMTARVGREARAVVPLFMGRRRENPAESRRATRASDKSRSQPPAFCFCFYTAVFFCCCCWLLCNTSIQQVYWYIPVRSPWAGIYMYKYIILLVLDAVWRTGKETERFISIWHCLNYLDYGTIKMLLSWISS